MEELPAMWRTELLHPLFVHFPIALLILATVVLLVYRFNLFPRWNKHLSFTALTLLISGTLLAWISVYTGTLADNIVGRHVCDPIELEKHEQFAYYTAILFSLVTLIEIVLKGGKINILSAAYTFKKSLAVLSIVLVISGAAGMGYVGHLGAKMVFQQAAAVHQPSSDCAEFE